MLIGLVAALSAAPNEAVLLKVRKQVLEPDGLTAALATAKSALESCAADRKADLNLHDVLNKTVTGYERRQLLATSTAKPMEKLLKAQRSAEKKVKSMQEDMDGDELQSKEDKAALKKLRDAKAAADEAITFAKLLERVKGGRDLKAMTYSPRSLLERHKAGSIGGDLTVLSEDPLVLTLDGWLGPTASEALDVLPAVLAERAKLPAEPEEGSGKPPQPPGKLCIQPEEGSGKPQSRPAKKVEAAIAEAQKAAKKGKSHDAATANLTDATAFASDFRAGNFSGCGPLTPALEAALAQVDVAWMVVNANFSVDLLDNAIGAAVGFVGIDAEAAFAMLKEAMTEHDDPATASPPDGWDEEEDGAWQAVKVPAESYMGAMSKALGAEQEGGVKDGMGAAYAFSSSAQLVRHRAATGGATGLHLECSDFANEFPAATAAAAYLFATDVAKGKGGEQLFPALNLKVLPKKGRLLLFETMMADGTCDPATATAVSPLKSGAADRLLLAKRYYSDSTFNRGQHNDERPNQPPQKLECDDTGPHGCILRSPAGTPEGGDAVMAGHKFKAQP